MIKKVMRRIYNDYLMGSRLDVLRQVLSEALAEGYEPLSLRELHGRVQTGLPEGRKYLVLRHDIDTDVGTARKIFELERALGVHGSFYFRLSTISLSLMRDIEASGGEVGYHFEECAALLKRKRFASRHELLREAGVMFEENITKFRSISGLRVDGVASHGDFANRKSRVINYELLNPELRRRCGINYEAYDRDMNAVIREHISDRMYPDFWHPVSPRVAILRNDSVIHILIHPRQWHSAPIINTVDNVMRVVEGVKFRNSTI